MARAKKKHRALTGIEVSTRVFGRSDSYMLRLIAKGDLTYENGEPIKPTGPTWYGHHTWTADDIQEVILCMYRLGRLNDDELARTLAIVLVMRGEAYPSQLVEHGEDKDHSYKLSATPPRRKPRKSYYKPKPKRKPKSKYKFAVERAHNCEYFAHKVQQRDENGRFTKKRIEGAPPRVSDFDWSAYYKKRKEQKKAEEDNG